ncbi:MAG: hypothetical protein ABIE84_01240 [bacterium]
MTRGRVILATIFAAALSLPFMCNKNKVPQTKKQVAPVTSSESAVSPNHVSTEKNHPLRQAIKTIQPPSDPEKDIPSREPIKRIPFQRTRTSFEAQGNSPADVEGYDYQGYWVTEVKDRNSLQGYLGLYDVPHPEACEFYTTGKELTIGYLEGLYDPTGDLVAYRKRGTMSSTFLDLAGNKLEIREAGYWNEGLILYNAEGWPFASFDFESGNYLTLAETPEERKVVWQTNPRTIFLPVYPSYNEKLFADPDIARTYMPNPFIEETATAYLEIPRAEIEDFCHALLRSLGKM